MKQDEAYDKIICLLNTGQRIKQNLKIKVRRKILHKVYTSIPKENSSKTIY